MILYNYTYNTSNNKLTVNRVEVAETEKTYKTINGYILNFRRTVNKNEIDTLIANWNYYMVSLTENKKLFIDKIQESLQKRIDEHKETINKYTNYIILLNKEKENTSC